MCATVASMPAVLMVPLTDLSTPIERVPVPEADVVTGGVSSAPVKFTFTSTAKADPLNAMMAAAATSARAADLGSNLLIITSMGRMPLHYPNVGRVQEH